MIINFDSIYFSYCLEQSNETGNTIEVHGGGYKEHYLQFDLDFCRGLAAESLEKDRSGEILHISHLYCGSLLKWVF